MSTNTPAGRQSRYAEIAQEFRLKIESGELCPGEKLPTFAQMRSEHGVSQATLERVFGVLEQEGLVARSAHRGTFVTGPQDWRPPQRNVIGVVWNQVATHDPYFAQLLTGIQSTTLKRGYEALFMHSTQAVLWEKVSGVITTESGPKHFRHLPKGMPNVTMWTPHKGIPSVGSDDYQGIREVVEYLLGQGHRRIGFLTVGCQPKSSDHLSKRRMEAYYDTLKAAGIVPHADWVRPLFIRGDIIYGSDSFRDFGHKRMNEWLRQGWADLGCTALLAQNDDTAIGVIQSLQAAGYKVPQDVSVVGFDGTERAEYFSPKLTTVRVPLQSISSACVDLLVELIEAHRKGFRPESTQAIVLPTTLSVGGSTGPANYDSGEGLNG